MMDIEWAPDKNEKLRSEYGFGFERIVAAMAAGSLLDDRTHPNVERYGHQRQLIVRLDNYVWVVPYVEDREVIFLKTMFPSRAATKEYLEQVP